MVEQGDLAQEPAGHHRSNDAVAAFDPDRAIDDHVELVTRLALEHEHLAGGDDDLAGQHADRLDAPLVEIGEQRDPAQHLHLVPHQAGG